MNNLILSIYFFIRNGFRQIGFGSFGNNSYIGKVLKVVGKKHIFIGNNCAIYKNARLEALTKWDAQKLDGKIVIGNDVFRNVAGKMLKVLARAQGGYIVEETRATYSAVVRNDGAYGTTALNSTTTKTFLYNENAINQYNGYLMTDVYKDLLAMRDDAEKLPVRKNLYIVIGMDQIPADKKSVASLSGLDKKALKAFLKSEKIDWNEIGDLVKVIDYIIANRK